MLNNPMWLMATVDSTLPTSQPSSPSMKTDQITAIVIRIQLLPQADPTLPMLQRIPLNLTNHRPKGSQETLMANIKNWVMILSHI